MALSFEERIRLEENYDVYDLIEILDVNVQEIIDAFEDKIENTEEILRHIGSI